MGDGTHAHEFMDNYISHEHGFAEATGTPAHIDEMRKPHPMQEVIDSVSVKVLRQSSALNGAEVEEIARLLRTHPEYTEEPGMHLDIEALIAALVRTVE